VFLEERRTLLGIPAGYELCFRAWILLLPHRARAASVSAVCQDEIASAPPRDALIRAAMGATAAILAIIYFGPAFVGVFKPQPDDYRDFVQEWLSVRNYRAGEPIYLPQRAAMKREIGADIPGFDVGLRYNAHPPVAVLLALPWAMFDDYATAHLAWNLVTVPLFFLSIVLLTREYGIAVQWWAIFPILTLTLLCQSLLCQLYQGQLNFVILMLLVAALMADRRGNQLAAGAAVGVAMALKIVPGLLLVYFAATRRWRAVAAAIVVAAGLNAIALAVFGIDAFRDYVTDVLPSLKVFRGGWRNISLTGYWAHVGMGIGAPAACAIAGVICQFAVVAMVWIVSRRATTPEERDRALGLAILGIPLASPIAWAHYFVFLLPPLLLLWQRLPRGLLFVAFAVATAALWAPERFYPELAIGRTAAAELTNTSPIPPGIVLPVLGLGPFTYALVVLFLLKAFAPFAPLGEANHRGAEAP
ncbi:MAG TPA: glycosyltransferase family 87 protein, partial [Gemmata sp.]|nr:glycosyltransferase family 87 protein [Gemmata sp.]